MTRHVNRRHFLAGIAGGLAFSTCSRMFTPGQSRQLNAIGPWDIEKFRASIKGQLLLPTDQNYDQVRRVESFNPTSDLHPEMIVRCVDPEDVIRSLAYARNNAIDLAVRGGGHDLLGASVCDGMVIDLSGMKEMAVDPKRRIARVAAGVRAGELNALASQSGLAPVMGCSPGVGVAGLTLGGGLGWFLGKHGMAADNLLSANLITANGRMLTASAKENSDLFWALRGGGGNFGIVTSLEFQLHPIDQVVGGVVVYRADIGEFLRCYRDFMKTAPEELTVELNIILTKQPLIAALVCWSGDPSQANQVLGALESFGPPIANNVEPVAYARLGERFTIIRKLLNQQTTQSPTERSQAGPPRNSGPAYNYWRGGSLDGLTDEAIERLDACTRSAGSYTSVGLGHYMHGQACRIGAHEAPLSRQAGRVTYFFSSSWIDPSIADAQIDWVTRSLDAMRSVSSKGTYINYLSSDRDEDVRASYGQSYDRLARVKRKYDPNNFFHRNRNIRP